MDPVKLFCPACGQKLAIPATDLRASYRCPRCNAVHVAGDLIAPSRTIAPMRILDVDATPARPRPRQFRELPRVDSSLPAPVLERSDASPRRVIPPLDEPLVDAPMARSAARPARERTEAIQPRPRSVDRTKSVAPPPGARLLSLLSAADRIDRALHRRRALVLSLAAALALFAAAMGDAATRAGWALLCASTVGFVLLVLALAAARLLAMRDAEGRWNGALVSRRIWSGLDEGLSSAQDFMVGTGAQKLVAGGALSAWASVALLVLRNLLSLIAPREAHVGGDTPLEIAMSFLSVGFPLSAAGSLAWLVGRRKLRTLGRQNEHLLDDTEVAPLVRAVKALPPVLDLGDPAARAAATRPSQPALLADLVEVLWDWQPPRFAHADPYLSSLRRHLLRHLADAQPERDRPLGAPGGTRRARIDLLLGNAVAIHLERRLDLSRAQRLIARAETTWDLWPEPGVLLLVLCDTAPPDAESIIGRAITNLRERGIPVVAVVAGGARNKLRRSSAGEPG